MTRKTKQTWLIVGGVCLFFSLCANDPAAAFNLLFLGGIVGAILFFVRKNKPSASPTADPGLEPREEEQEAEGEALDEPPPENTLLGAIVDNGEITDNGVFLDPSMRNRHVYVIGKTRTGKTTLIKRMILQDMERGAGVAFIDPHGDAAEELLGLIPDHRIEDLIYFDPTDPASPSFNPFRLPYTPTKLTEDIVSVFRMLVGESSWGPRMEHLLRFGLLTLLADPARSHSLRDLRTLYLDEGKRTELIENIQNEQLLEFWDTEYPTIPQSASNPILNKLSAFLAPMSDLERVFSQVENDLDFSAVLNTGKILLVNLAKGVLGDEPSRLLGGLIVACIQQAALARASMPPDERQDFYFYVDEFHNFTVASFESILSESAKYRLNLTLANQTLGQLSASLQRSIFGNCATLVSFQVSAEDAPKLIREMHGTQSYARKTKGGKDYIPLLDFLEHWQEGIESAVKNKWGDPWVAKCMRQFRHIIERQHGRYTDEVKPRNKAWTYVLNRLYDPTLDLQELRFLFPSYDFSTTSFPDTDYLINLRPFYACARVDTAKNVTAIRCLPTSDPNPATREQVAKHLERYSRSIEEVHGKKPTPKEPESFLE